LMGDYAKNSLFSDVLLDFVIKWLAIDSSHVAYTYLLVFSGFK
jgi:hypothetical protein